MAPRSRAAALLAGVLVAGALVAPGAASPSPFVVYELRRVGRSGGNQVRVDIEGRAVGGPGMYVIAEFRPKGKGYEARAFGIVQYSDPDTETRTYGWPAAADPCGAAPCLVTLGHGKITSHRTLPAAPGDRLFIIGVRGQVTVRVLSEGWAARPASIGFRVVRADEADTTGVFVAGNNVEHFRAATAPGGARGSIGFADVPCDAGSAVLASDAGERRTFECDGGGWGMGAEYTERGRRWTVAGSTLGFHGLPFRLVVVDYPA